MLLEWFMLFSVNLAASMSPGPAFLLTLRNSIAHERRIGVWTAIGLGVGEIPIILLIIFGLAALLTQSQILFMTVRIVGAAYLLYLGYSSFKSSAPVSIETEKSTIAQLTSMQAFRQGVITNLMNPKGWLYFVALFSQFIGPDTPLPVRFLYGATSVTIEMAWFSFVAIVLTIPHIKSTFARFMGVIQKVCGVLFIALAGKILLELV